MTRLFSRFTGETGEIIEQKIKPLDMKQWILLYLAPFIVFFAVAAIGLWSVPGDFSGMYGNDDGIWAAWNVRGILEWSQPFDLSPFNPLSGMGSTFLPNTPWLNPAAMALALPLPREVTYLISYFIYFLELGLSLTLLFRIIGLSSLKAIFCAELYLLLFFPPSNGNFVTLQWYSLAPVNAHLVAICNVILVLILVIGRQAFWANIFCSATILFISICGVFSAPITFLTYAPVYATAAAALLLGAKPKVKELAWKLAAVITTGSVLWLAGVNEYLQGTSLISGRAAFYPRAFAAGAELLTWEYWHDALTKVDACAHPFFLCPGFPSLYLFMGSFTEIVLQILERSRHKALAIGMLLCVTGTYVFEIAGNVNLFGSAHAISSTFLVWSVYPFVALFFGLLILRLFRIVASSFRIIASRLSFTASLNQAGYSLTVFFLLLVIPTLALTDWELRTRFYQPPPPAHNPDIPLLGRSGVRHAKVGTITNYLIDHASIAPGMPFRGYTATYLVDPQGPVRTELQKRSGRREELSKLELYVAAGPYFDLHYQSRLQGTDLWEHNIPTLEEYGQWVTRSVYVGINMLFNPNEKVSSKAFEFNESIFLHLYGLNLDLLPFLGVRYLITDMEQNDPRTTLKAKQSSDDAPTIFLYEIANPNLGNWSPTSTVSAHSYNEATTLLRSGQLNLTKTAIIFGDIEGPLSPARDITFRFVRGGFRVTATAAGKAAIVLPVQYSACWRALAPETANPTAHATLQRVNGFETLLRFSDHIDATFKFTFNLFGNSGCRSLDSAELKTLGIN